MFTGAIANEVKRATKGGALQQLRKRDEFLVRGARSQKIAALKVWFNDVLTLKLGLKLLSRFHKGMFGKDCLRFGGSRWNSKLKEEITPTNHSGKQVGSCAT